jgi:hypothetical protein
MNWAVCTACGVFGRRGRIGGTIVAFLFTGLIDDSIEVTASCSYGPGGTSVAARRVLVHAIVVYVFPFILLLFEWGLRTVIGVDASGFMGPTLAAAALSCLLPLTKPTSMVTQTVQARKVVLIVAAEVNFIAGTWLLILIELFVWSGTCYLSLTHPDRLLWAIPLHTLVGAAAYVLSLLMIIAKEQVI